MYAWNAGPKIKISRGQEERIAISGCLLFSSV
jgi:hypothetical protein